MTLGEIIKKYRKEHGLSMDAFSKRSGISKSYISLLEKNKHPKTGKPIAPSAKSIKQAAEGMNMNFDELFSLINSEIKVTTKKNSINWNNTTPIKMTDEFIEIPILGRVPAGVPIEAIENVIDTIKVSTDFINTGYDHFALRVKGDSMYPKYLEGDTIIIEVRHDCESGEDAVVYVNGYDATLKTVIKNDDGTITLRPRNPEYMEKTYGPGDAPIQILGPVVRQIR